MLILIAGITGNIGQHAATYGLSQGHTIRGLGRSPDKLPSSIFSSLESFVPSTNYYDIAALDSAVRNVDAVICAYSGLPELHLDAQLLLIRAAERAGVKKYLAASWNYDWRNIKFGEDEPVYDAAIAFHRHVEISSSIKPLHIFSGMLIGVFFGEFFTPDYEGGVMGWENKTGERIRRVMDIWGTGNEPWYFTTEEDAGAWAIEVVTAPNAEEGGFVTVCSWITSLNDLANTYDRIRNTGIIVRNKGTIQDLENLAISRKAAGGRRNFWDWHRLWFHLFCVQGTWNLTNIANEKYSYKPSTLEESLRKHPEF